MPTTLVGAGRGGFVLCVFVTCGLVLPASFQTQADGVTPELEDATDIFRLTESYSVGNSISRPYLARSAEVEKSASQPKAVKCYYFKTPPLRTYCHVLGLTGPVKATEASLECSSLSMELLSIKTTPPHRICTLMNIFHLNESKLWIADISDAGVTQPLDSCNLEVLNETVTKIGRNCTICSIAVVCDAGFYHSNRSTCVTVEDGPKQDSAEYCYHEEAVTAWESAEECNKTSGTLVDAYALRPDGPLGYITPIVNTGLELWVDVRKEHVSNLSGVVAFNVVDSWDDVCISVWFGRAVPWFFRRPCTDKLPIVCEVMNRITVGQSFLGHKFFSCDYGNKDIVGFCILDRNSMTLEKGRQGCSSRGMQLLGGGSLSELSYSQTFIGWVRSQHTMPLSIWDVNFRNHTETPRRYWWMQDRHPSSWDTTDTCYATDITDGKRTGGRCEDKHPYICRREWHPNIEPDPTSNIPLCDNWNETKDVSQPLCLNTIPTTYENSKKRCQDLGMELLPDMLSADDYARLIRPLESLKALATATSYWLLREKCYEDKCVVLNSHGAISIQSNVDCSTKFPFVCTVGSRTPASRRKEFCCGSEKGGVRWPKTHVGTTAVEPCHGSAMTRKCLDDGTWAEAINASNCRTPDVEDILKKDAVSVSDLMIQLDKVGGYIAFGSDVVNVSNYISRILENVDKWLENMTGEQQRKKTVALTGSVANLTVNSMKNEKVWDSIPKDERLQTAVGLMQALEDTVRVMPKYHKADGELVQVKQKEIVIGVVKRKKEGTLKLPMIIPNKQGQISVTLPAGFVKEGKASDNVSLVFIDNPLLKNALGFSSRSSYEQKLMEATLATAVATATVLVNDAAVRDISGNVTLTFQHNAGKGKVPSCVFLQKNGEIPEWSSNGCGIASFTDNEVVCTCNHLTNFAVLMSPRGDFSKIKSLQWITKIGCSISIICLIACIVIFTMYRNIHRGIRSTIHRNLCVTLLLAEILLLTALDGPTGPLCKWIAYVLHFLFLCAFAFMALEGVHIIVLLWKVFNQKRTYYERYYIAGYGIPLIIASVPFGGWYNDYVEGGGYCWLPEKHGIRYSFIGPVACVIVLNLGALFLVLWKMSHVRLVVEKTTVEKVRNWVRGTFILLPILGVTWLLGFLMIAGGNEVGVAGAYLFTVFNSLQGLGIFICHVLMSKKTRDAILRSAASTGSMVKDSVSSRSGRTGTSSTRTTWYPFSATSNNSKISPPVAENQRTNSVNTDSDDVSPCAAPDCWPGNKFKYDLKLNESNRDIESTPDSFDPSHLSRFRITKTYVA